MSDSGRGRSVLLSVLAVLAVLLPAAAQAQPAPDPVTSARIAVASFDTRIGAHDCALLGRVYRAGSGCNRHTCVAGARMGNPGVDAEVCTRTGRGGRLYATSVPYDRCKALGRTWIAQVNWCASNPDRTVSIINHAPQCTGRRSTYVTHAETEGRYDECLRPSAVAALRDTAKQSGESFERVSEDGSAVLCSYRPAHVFVDGVCRAAAPGTPKAPGGTLLIGDSIAWRGTDELGKLRKDWDIDGIPGRRYTDLDQRLGFYLAGHDAPTGLVLELGTNAAGRYGRADLDRTLATLPDSTRIMLVLPYRATPARPTVQLAAQARYDRWMHKLAASRPLTCVADWPRLVGKYPGLLVDGVHPTHRSEGRWAEWISDEWSGCAN